MLYSTPKIWLALLNETPDTSNLKSFLIYLRLLLVHRVQTRMCREVLFTIFTLITWSLLIGGLWFVAILNIPIFRCSSMVVTRCIVAIFHRLIHRIFDYITNLSQNKPKSLSALTNNQSYPHYFKSGKKFFNINIKYYILKIKFFLK